MKIRHVETHEVGTGEITMEYAKQTFKELLTFQGYGFCLGHDALVCERNEGTKRLGDVKVGDWLKSPCGGGDAFVRVVGVYPQGLKDAYRFSVDGGGGIVATRDHRVLCNDGQCHSLGDIFHSHDSLKVRNDRGKHVSVNSMESLGKIPVMDIEVDSDDHLFYADGLAVHNCKAHATSYSVYSAVQMYLQSHYFIEYMCALLNHIDRAKEKKGHLILDERVDYCVREGIAVLYPDIDRSASKWMIVDGDSSLIAPLSNIKGFSEKDTESIMEHRPYADLNDFVAKTGIGTGKFESLLFARALSRFGSVGDIYNRWYLAHTEKDRSGKRKWAKKKAPPQADIYDLFGGEQQTSECSADLAAASVNEVEFSKSELDDRCLDMNGFVLKDKIFLEYSWVYSKRMSDFFSDPNIDGNILASTVHRIGDVDRIERSENSRPVWVLVQVQSISSGLKTRKTGQSFSKVMLCDGRDSLSLFIWGEDIPSWCRRGAVVIVPLRVVTQEDGTNKVSYAKYAINKTCGVPVLRD